MPKNGELVEFAGFKVQLVWLEWVVIWVIGGNLEPKLAQSIH